LRIIGERRRRHRKETAMLRYNSTDNTSSNARDNNDPNQRFETSARFLLIQGTDATARSTIALARCSHLQFRPRRPPAPHPLRRQKRSVGGSELPRLQEKMQPLFGYIPIFLGFIIISGVKKKKNPKMAVRGPPLPLAIYCCTQFLLCFRSTFSIGSLGQLTG
jgi:hypothetical protein